MAHTVVFEILYGQANRYMDSSSCFTDAQPIICTGIFGLISSDYILLQIPQKATPRWDQFHQSADARGRIWEFSAALSTGVKAV
ncbi:hypothetical protein J6590_070891 [Homalodisca vitripennis]|nr:hypothetical protein J6590_070891 [Homalodisca vitripennis]